MRLMKRGSQLVRGGTFFHLKTWEFITIPRSGGYLPGQEEETYIPTSRVLVLIAGPLMGLAFVTVLPLVSLLAIPVALLKGVQALARWVTAPGALPAGGGRRRGM